MSGQHKAKGRVMSDIRTWAIRFDPYGTGDAHLATLKCTTDEIKDILLKADDFGLAAIEMSPTYDKLVVQLELDYQSVLEERGEAEVFAAVQTFKEWEMG